MIAEPTRVDVADLVERAPIGRFHISLVVLSCLVTFFDGFDMMMIAFTATYVQAAFALDNQQLAYVFSSALAGMVLGGVAFGCLADRYGRRPAIILASFVFGATTIGTALSPTYEAIVALRFIAGIALGGMLPIAWALNIEFVPKRHRSMIVTIVMVGYSLGAASAGPMTVWLAPKYGWQTPFYFGGGMTLLSGVLLLFFLPESLRFQVLKGKAADPIRRTLFRLAPRQPSPVHAVYFLGDEVTRPRTRSSFSELFAGRLALVTPLIWLGYVASSLAMYFLATWGPLIYEKLGFERDVAAYSASVAGLFGSIAGLVLTAMIGRRGPRVIALYPAIALPLFLIASFASLGGLSFIIVSALCTVLVTGAHFAIISIVGLFYPSSVRAIGSGWAASIAKLGGILGPIAGGYVLQSNVPVIRTYALLAICPAVLLVCALLIGTLIPRSAGSCD